MALWVCTLGLMFFLSVFDVCCRPLVHSADAFMPTIVTSTRTTQRHVLSHTASNNINNNNIVPSRLYSQRRPRRRPNNDYYDDEEEEDDDDYNDVIDDSRGYNYYYYEDDYEDDNNSVTTNMSRRQPKTKRIDAESDNYGYNENTNGARRGRMKNDGSENSGPEDDEKIIIMDDDEEENEQEEQDRPRGGYYRVYFNDGVDPSETQLDWEACSKDGKLQSLVLLPPAAVERPRAVLHFVGGTFFGSAPKLWYRKLLEGIVRNTQTALIVTPIPVTLFQSPLQHTKLSKKLQQAFEYAWYTVLEDEYGEEALQDVPLCGIGHSLGSRLLAVLTTINQNKVSPQPKQRRRSKRGRDQDTVTATIPPYKAFILMSFTNFGASAGIPGVGTLLKQSRQQERASKVDDERQRYRKARKARNDWWLDDEIDEYEDYERDEYDGDWAEVVEELQALVKEQATRVKTALTPKSKDLEFFPSPDQLWKAIGQDQRYAVNETLLVQFDNDPVDQSSKLAQMLVETNSTNIKFARLRGTHLTPVTVMESDVQEEGGSVQRLLGTSAGSLWKAILGKSKTKEQAIAMQELRQSIVSYINDIVVN
ncbi:DUF1350 domain containing protein [Nitzschia inconspicua]|uniref:DUF1350 domain containing protein n=1 Tax=Nitzschia inconspicua TaxID=303405 RepID=A0A9K3L617_9STRA|nr:DUF1350 domain containing protein [Nitzschia inconspicua]